MPVLHVEELPADLYEHIRRRAAAQNREFAAEVIFLLERALATEEEQAKAAHAAALADLRGRRWTPPPEAPDSVSLLREDRDR
jgi:plasmid stability protein